MDDVDAEYDLDPFLMTVLSKKVERVTADMTQTLLKSARSSVINSARDFSSGITRYDGRQFMIDEGLPVHLGNVHLAPQYTLEHFDDISPGDCFLTNSPYAGNTHHADYTLHVPVFHDGEPLFWAINRAHQADVGAPEPTTYPADAATLYEEGTHFPSVRIQAEYEDIEDVVRICKLNIRAGEEQWHGDYRAQVSAVRTGERELIALCEEYGSDVIEQFVDDWLRYGERMMIREIESLPDADLEYTAYHDPIPDVTDDPIPVTVSISIDAQAGRIAVDLTDNVGNLPCGFNLSRATTEAAVYGGIFHNLSSEVPHNQGSIDRIDIEMETARLVGDPEYPVGTGVATTNVCSVLFNAVQAAFGQLGEPYGLAEGNAGMHATEPVVAGTDSRRDDRQFVNQMMLAAGGGPAVHGHDGWITWSTVSSAGIINHDSVEIDEQKYPLYIARHELVPDSGGAGKWRGAPCTVTEFRVRDDPVTFAYTGTGRECPPQGIRGGRAGMSLRVRKRTPDGKEVELPPLVMDPIDIRPGETLISRNVGGGGYGDPLERDPDAVRHDVEEGIVTPSAAREAYGVVTREAANGRVEVDSTETTALRESERGGDR